VDGVGYLKPQNISVGKRLFYLAFAEPELAARAGDFNRDLSLTL
jgi:hypothetical protein